jgi:hypothetical protein
MWAIQWAICSNLYAGTIADWCKLTDDGVLKFNTYEEANEYLETCIWEFHALVVKV